MGIERALGRALRWTLVGAVVSLPLLFVPQASPRLLMAYTIVHLAALVGFGLFVVRDLSRFQDGSWFAWLGPMGRHIASVATVVALTVGVVALVTLPTAAALRLAPSLQFLQLLSALDIAWAAGATLVGVHLIGGRRWGQAAGTMVGIVCVWSIWRYLDVVGFAADGGWQVDGAALMRHVLPYDIAAALIAVTAVVIGARRAAHSTASSDTAPTSR